MKKTQKASYCNTTKSKNIMRNPTFVCSVALFLICFRVNVTTKPQIGLCTDVNRSQKHRFKRKGTKTKAKKQSNHLQIVEAFAHKSENCISHKKIAIVFDETSVFHNRKTMWNTCIAHVRKNPYQKSVFI